MTWAVLPIPPRSSSVAIKDEDVVRSIERASRTWSKNCGLAEAPDLVSVVASPPAADQAILLKWESLDRIRNSAFSLREAIACFNPYLDDSCAMVGGWLYMARDPVIGVRRGELVHTESATWLTHSLAHQQPSSQLPLYSHCFDETMLHEFGHTLGLDNFEDPRSMMYDDPTEPERANEPKPCDCGFLRRLVSAR